jgi:hypothetical protein
MRTHESIREGSVDGGLVGFSEIACCCAIRHLLELAPGGQLKRVVSIDVKPLAWPTRGRKRGFTLSWKRWHD